MTAAANFRRTAGLCHGFPMDFVDSAGRQLSVKIVKYCEDSPATAAIEDRSQVLPMVASEHCDDAHVHTAPPAIVAMEVPIGTKASGKDDHADICR